MFRFCHRWFPLWQQEVGAVPAAVVRMLCLCIAAFFKQAAQTALQTLPLTLWLFPSAADVHWVSLQGQRQRNKCCKWKELLCAIDVSLCSLSCGLC
mmetsp:Transcript_15424/g.33935  ORF Transcript_15424/g.33935 Transcript_15424/m.33935 type:complete len:96 (+) Transcript_15424:1243-1530(+)